MAGYDVSATSAAPAAAVWGLLADARTWPVWSPVDEFVVDRSTGDGRAEVGAVRAFRTGDVVTGERITALEPLALMAYEDAFNDALHDYRVEVELVPHGSGTGIRWHSTYTPAPGLESVLPEYLQDFQQRMVDGLAAYAARRPAE